MPISENVVKDMKQGAYIMHDISLYFGSSLYNS